MPRQTRALAHTHHAGTRGASAWSRACSSGLVSGSCAPERELLARRDPSPPTPGVMQRGGDAGVVCHGIETSPALDIAARVTTGSAMPDGSTSHLDGPTDVLLYSVEDAIAETLYWRAQALGADMARIYVITGVIDVGDDMERALRLQFDWTAITHAVESTGAKLLILDPLIAAMQGDANSNADVRRATCCRWCHTARRGHRLPSARHQPSQQGNGSSAMYRVLGAVSTIAAARTGLIVARHPEDDNERVLAVAKSNLGPTPPALRFTPRSVEAQPGVESVMLD